jgi:HlyD family secretion protein
MSREAQVTEQLNFLRNTQMTMETNRLNLRRDLLEIDLEITHLERRNKQIRPLVETGAIAADTLKALKEDLAYFYARRQLTQERQAQEDSIRQIQLAQLEESANMLNRNLLFARKNLENLTVKSPITGYLSEFNIELGESKDRGDRLGQIDIPDGYKLRVSLDEFYLNQVNVGMTANIDIEGTTYDLRVSKIDSQVENSQFSIEIELPELTTDIKRGQSLNLSLLLGDDQENAVLLPRGQFYASTGGNWVFVLLPDKDIAERRVVRLGKKNRDYYHVLEGLSKGDRVVISSYSSFDKAKLLKLN